MRDLIDRQATIEALGERPRFSTGGGYEMGVKEQYDRDLLAIINMPSAQLEEIRETGISRYGVAAWLVRIDFHPHSQNGSGGSGYFTKTGHPYGI